MEDVEGNVNMLFWTPAGCDGLSFPFPRFANGLFMLPPCAGEKLKPLFDDPKEVENVEVVPLPKGGKEEVC